MDNHERRKRYATGSGRTPGASVEQYLHDRYTAGTADQILTPAQRRRVLHKRAGTGAHRARKRQAQREALARVQAHWNPYAQPSRKARNAELLSTVKAGLAKMGLNVR